MVTRYVISASDDRDRMISENEGIDVIIASAFSLVDVADGLAVDLQSAITAVDMGAVATVAASIEANNAALRSLCESYGDSP